MFLRGCFLLVIFSFLFVQQIFSQFVYIDNKIFKVNGCPIYFNGANTPWDNWNDFGGSYDAAFWSTHYTNMKNSGMNSSRVWISCNGDVQPNINSDGTVTGVSAQFWANLDNFFASAQTNGIYIMATMMSFDHTKNTYVKYNSWRNMMNDPTKIQTYIDNYLVPFVNRYKTNPYLMSIDISNEIEWVAENNDNMRCSYAVLQRFVGMCASAIHNNPRANGTTVLVTLGSAATKWNATFMRNGSNGAGWQANPDGNKWSDVAIKAQYNQPNAVLDFYSPHYYGWINEYYSNFFQKTPTDFGINEKAVLVGETPGGNPGIPNMAPLVSYEALKTNGYQGHFPWTSNGVDAYGDMANFSAAALQFKNNYPNLIFPNCPLPIHFLVVSGRNENGRRTVNWVVAGENIKYANFLVYASSDGINYSSVYTTTFSFSNNNYSYEIENDEEKYFYIESESDHSIDKSKVVFVGTANERPYTLYYSGEEPILLANLPIVIKVISMAGVVVVESKISEKVSYTLRDNLDSGIYLVEIKVEDDVTYEKIRIP